MSTQEEQERRYQENLERIKRLRLMDDEFFTKCFEDAPACVQLVLRIILELPDLVVEEVHTQVFVENLMNRSVRLDVLATDSRGRRYNIEIQRADKGAGRRRARYNSSMMDAILLPKGEDVDNLPETFVVFITENDVIGKGQPLYKVERYFSDGEPFDDGSHILYVNGANRSDTPLGRLMHDFACTEPREMYYDTLAERVRFYKESREGNVTMSRIFEEMYKQGEKEKGIKIAKTLLFEGGIKPELIAQWLEIPLDEVKKLQAQGV